MSDIAERVQAVADALFEEKRIVGPKQVVAHFQGAAAAFTAAGMAVEAAWCRRLASAVSGKSIPKPCAQSVVSPVSEATRCP